MSKEVLHMVQRMDRNDLDLQMAMQCAPVFGGLKVSNLLIVDSGSRSRVLQNLKDSPISHITLSEYRGKITMLLYREQELKDYFKSRRVKNLLRFLGYEDVPFWELMMEFRRKFQAYQKGTGEFPHEMGIFLGYPVEDVAGFIRHCGQNSLCTGYWKVYRDSKEKKSLFERFEKEEEKMVRYVCGGGSIRRMAL